MWIFLNTLSVLLNDLLELNKNDCFSLVYQGIISLQNCKTRFLLRSLRNIIFSRIRCKYFFPSWPLALITCAMRLTCADEPSESPVRKIALIPWNPYTQSKHWLGISYHKTMSSFKRRTRLRSWLDFARLLSFHFLLCLLPLGHKVWSGHGARTVLKIENTLKW